MEGLLNFAMTGILASISSALADADVSLFALSTYETDYILVDGSDLPEAVSALECAGHRIRETS